MPSILRESPAMRAYAQRVGADEINFRRFMVREWRDHYYTETTLITLSRDGEIECSSPAHAPTDEERAAIRAEIAMVEFPQSVKVGSIHLLRDQLRSDHYYEFRDYDDGGDIIMVQELRRTQDGRKYYLPWTYWSDGQWRQMEPDGPLPFWRPARSEGLPKIRIMIHEGAKSAAIADRIVRERQDHPWREFMEGYEHWGMIGGALAPHRADYDALRKQKAIEVIYVCDNDYEGKSALAKVSKAYGQSMKGIYFTDDWPKHYDVADPMPRHFFDETGIYVGPGMAALTQPATWATKTKMVEGKKVVTLARGFVEEWVHCVEPEVYVHIEYPERLLTVRAFNDTVAPFSDVKDVAALVNRDNAIKTPGLRYVPGKPSGIYQDDVDKGHYINTYRERDLKPRDGDPKPWIDFMEHLCPDERDRLELYRWAATFIARPDIKMMYGLLLISQTQGVGKSTFGEILATIIGRNNVSFPSEEQIVSGTFNAWLAHKRLASVNEIYSGQSSKAYNRLKSVITERTLHINRKFIAEYSLDNYVHVIACSNSMRALKLDFEDRRWFVPTITNRRQSQDFWNEFHRWLEKRGGYAIVKRWAFDFFRHAEPVSPGGAAPWSTLKLQVIEEGYSPGMYIIRDIIETIRTEKAGLPFAVFDIDLVEAVQYLLYDGKHSDKLEKPRTARTVAAACGLKANETRVRRRFTMAMLLCTPDVVDLPVDDLRQLAVDVMEVAVRIRESRPI